MNKVIATLIVLAIPSTVSAEPRILTGEPEYESARAREIVEQMLEAHGGKDALAGADGLAFSFFTKVIGNGAPPFRSREHTDLQSGRARVEYEGWNAVIGYDGQEVWSKNWPMPLPPGFFAGLTSSFVTLPWITQREDAQISAPKLGAIPGHDELYHVVTVRFSKAGPHVPGEYYELYIDRESKLLEGIGFNITHPGMMQVGSQPIGPNYHRFLEYARVGNAIFPSYYTTLGYNSANGGIVEAMHSVYDIRLDQPLPEEETQRPDDGTVDRATSDWWSG